MMLLVNAVLICVGITSLLIVSWRFRRMTTLLDALHTQTPSESGEVRFQVWVSNDRERKRWFKMSPSQEVGILIIRPAGISLYSIHLNGQHFIRRYDRINLHTEWIGNQGMGDSNMQWFALYDGENRILISAHTGFNAIPSRRQTAEIYRNIAGQHEQFPGTKEFALEKNRASLAVLVVLAVLMVYTIADGFFLNPLEVVGFPKIAVPPILLSLIVTAVLVMITVVIYRILIRFSIPGREALGLACLSGIMLMVSFLPLGKRIDTLLAVNSMEMHAYRMTQEGIFEPVDEGLPKLDLRVRCDYWKQFAQDHSYQFALQKGGLGLWQFDGRAFDQEIKAYLKKPAGNIIDDAGHHR